MAKNLGGRGDRENLNWQLKQQLEHINRQEEKEGTDRAIQICSASTSKYPFLRKALLWKYICHYMVSLLSMLVGLNQLISKYSSTNWMLQCGEKFSSVQLSEKLLYKSRQRTIFLCWNSVNRKWFHHIKKGTMCCTLHISNSTPYTALYVVHKTHS